MKKRELKEKTTKELADLLGKFRERIADLRFGKSTSRPKNVREMRELRKNSARALTFLKLKQETETAV
jgi:ribosomal protein L29